MPERSALSLSTDQIGVLWIFGQVDLTGAKSQLFPPFPLCVIGASAAPRTSKRANAREHGAVSHNAKLQVYARHPTVPLFCLPAATPPSRPAQRVGIYTSQFRMVSSQAERSGVQHSRAHRWKCPQCANGAHVFRYPKKSSVFPVSYRATSRLPPGNAAIAACQARVHE